MKFTLIPFLLLAVPIAEIAAFIVVGREIGVLATLALVAAMAFIGVALLRWQGLGVLGRIRQAAERGEAPERELVHGAMIVVGGILLIIPGFVTDAFGLLLFVPPVRDGLWRLIRGRIEVRTATAQAEAGRAGPRVIDLSPADYRPGGGPSPWQRD